jgi:hypothetical protein
MPMPNFHVCHIKPASSFQKGSQRTLKRGSVQVVIGRLGGETKTTLESIHYPVSGWSEDKARADCNEKGGQFVAARKES